MQCFDSVLDYLSPESSTKSLGKVEEAKLDLREIMKTFPELSNADAEQAIEKDLKSLQKYTESNHPTGKGMKRL